MKASFLPTDSMSKVFAHVEANRTDGRGAFSLMTTFPRKIYNKGDSTTLQEAGKLFYLIFHPPLAICPLFSITDLQGRFYLVTRSGWPILLILRSPLSLFASPVIAFQARYYHIQEAEKLFSYLHLSSTFTQYLRSGGSTTYFLPSLQTPSLLYLSSPSLFPSSSHLLAFVKCNCSKLLLRSSGDTEIEIKNEHFVFFIKWKF